MRRGLRSRWRWAGRRIELVATTTLYLFLRKLCRNSCSTVEHPPRHVKQRLPGDSWGYETRTPERSPTDRSAASSSDLPTRSYTLSTSPHLSWAFSLLPYELQLQGPFAVPLLTLLPFIFFLIISSSGVLGASLRVAAGRTPLSGLLPYSTLPTRTQPTMPASIASSSSSQSRSSSSTSPSSIHLDSDYEQFSSIQKGSDELVRRIIHENKESKLFLSAWRVRCETLETEVARLAGLLESLEASRGREETRRETGRVAVEETKVSISSLCGRRNRS